MAYKIITLLSAVATVINAGYIAHAPAVSYSSVGISHGHAPIAAAISSYQPAYYTHASYAPIAKAVVVDDHHAPAHYSFEYGVKDPHTGDVKSQHETREGDVVKGYYSLNEPDGTKRIVHYTADPHNGFNAHVERAGHAVHAVPVKTAVHVAAAPALVAYDGGHYGGGYGYSGLGGGHHGPAVSYAAVSAPIVHGGYGHHY